MADGAPQPGTRVRGVFYVVDLPITLQENILRQFFRYLAIAQETQCEAEHHRLVVGDDTGEIKPHTDYYGPSRPGLANKTVCGNGKNPAPHHPARSEGDAWKG